ncbi:carboxylate-amine ligase [Nocardioides mesophilus]|uniref:Putative glutamate--cysteine ligase 2 n=1 Tax=Nocardioides mesophilus TaxID=433659 RepID=A0A7G9RDH0_9ACTN|nr:glutamate--cysteine ligase [Nocardioides mesophilus]QNN53645.1 glutamate--cysteine ligase [Nocardioides mesophilus]
MSVRKIGVEEEMLLVDPDTHRLTAVAHRAVRHHDGPEVEQELFLQQIETATPPAASAEELYAGIVAGRRAVGQAAEVAGARAVAMGVPVLVDPDEHVTPKPRYERIKDEYGELAGQALACAMHMHVDVTDDEEAVAVVDRVRPWLPVLLALSANSPFWRGQDTGHASWRSQIWTRWPTGGPSQPYGGAATYRETADRLVAWGAGLDTGMLYFDVRVAESYPTVEVRVADVCTEVDDAVLVALLARALVTTAAEDWRAGTPDGLAGSWRADLLKAAHWRAGRYGTPGPLVHPVELALAPTRAAVDALLEHVGDALEEAGDERTARQLFEQMLARGNGAVRRRSVLESSGSLTSVVQDLADRTEASWSPR